MLFLKRVMKWVQHNYVSLNCEINARTFFFKFWVFVEPFWWNVFKKIFNLNFHIQVFKFVSYLLHLATKSHKSKKKKIKYVTLGFTGLVISHTLKCGGGCILNKADPVTVYKKSWTSRTPLQQPPWDNLLRPYNLRWLNLYS